MDTTTPKDKAGLIERIRQEYAALDRTIGELSEEQMTLVAADGWSVKDNLAHIAAWQGILRLFHMGGRPFQEAAPGISADYIKDDVHRINDGLYRRDRDLSLHEVLDRFRRSHQETLALIEGMSEAELFRTYTPAGRDSSSTGQLADWIAGDTYEHYSEHGATIRELAEREAGAA
jgi:hypothetical protein